MGKQTNLAVLAPRLGYLVNILILGLGALGIYYAVADEHMRHLGVAIYCCMVGLMIAPLEMPVLCICISSVTDTLNDKVKMNNWVFRAIIYIVLSSIMFAGFAWSIIAGVILVMQSMLYIVATAQGLREPDDIDLGEDTPIV